MKYTIDTHDVKRLAPKAQPWRLGKIIILGLAALALVEAIFGYGNGGYYPHEDPTVSLLIVEALHHGVGRLSIVGMAIPLVVFPATWGRLRRRLWDTFAVSFAIALPFALTRGVLRETYYGLLNAESGGIILSEIGSVMLNDPIALAFLILYYGIKYGVPFFGALYLVGIPTMYPVRGEW